MPQPFSSYYGKMRGDARIEHASPLANRSWLLLFCFPLAGHLTRKIKIAGNLSFFDGRRKTYRAVGRIQRKGQLVPNQGTLAYFRRALV